MQKKTKLIKLTISIKYFFKINSNGKESGKYLNRSKTVQGYRLKLVKKKGETLIKVEFI